MRQINGTTETILWIMPIRIADKNRSARSRENSDHTDFSDVIEKPYTFYTPIVSMARRSKFSTGLKYEMPPTTEVPVVWQRKVQEGVLGNFAWAFGPVTFRRLTGSPNSRYDRTLGIQELLGDRADLIKLSSNS